jgi:putative addiction module component (TIGR02574 family)
VRNATRFRDIETARHTFQTLASIEIEGADLLLLQASTLRPTLTHVLALPEDERLALASEIIASVDGPGDPDWESAWVAELDRRVDAAKARGAESSDWTEVRARILKRLGNE